MKSLPLPRCYTCQKKCNKNCFYCREYVVGATLFYPEFKKCPYFISMKQDEVKEILSLSDREFSINYKIKSN